MNPKKICAMTMARNDNFFLERWIRHYGRELGYGNLYIFLDGKDQEAPADPSGLANIVLCDKIEGDISKLDPERIDAQSDRAARLLERYDIVIGCDADEFLCVDPSLGIGLADYLSSLDIRTSVSGLGMDVCQHLGKEKAFDPAAGTMLSQRRYAIVEPDYTKPCVINRPVRWGVGYHRVRRHNFHIDPNLYMFHFGCFDLEMLKNKLCNSELLKAGWEEHLKKRRHAMDVVTACDNVLEGDAFFPKARLVQTWLRPIYKLNRPSMLRQEIVIRIPERFSDLV